MPSLVKLKFPAFISLSIALTLLTGNAFATVHQCAREEVNDRPRIGLVLGGGGARGYAHVGVLKKLEELRIPYDYIAGTSMGSIVGGLVATGMQSGELADVVRQIDWSEMLKDKTEREDLPFRRKTDDDLGLFGPKLGIGKDSTLLPKGVVSGQNIVFMFESVTSQRVNTANFDQLPIPYRAIATDIVTGDMVVIGDGEISMAMRASMAVPAVFDPVRRNDALLVDGGLVRNLPVDVARDMGADVVIAIDVGTKLASKDEITNALTIVYQMSGLLTVFNTDVQIETLTENDVLISPEIGNKISSADFEKLDEAIPIGYAAADALHNQLQQYSLSEAEYRSWRQQVKNCVDGPPQVDFVQLDNQSRFSDEVLLELITIESGKTLDLDELSYDLKQIYALGFIRQARYSIVEEDGQQGLKITVQQDDRGHQFLETGLDLSLSGRGSSFDIRLGYLNTQMDDRGSEFRAVVQIGQSPGLFANYYKLLEDGLKYSFEPSMAIFSRPLLIFDGNGDAISEIELDEIGAAITFGRNFGRAARVLAGFTRYKGEMDITIGNPDLEPFDFDGAELFAEFQFDRLDDRYLPGKGWYSRLKYTHSDEGLGADLSFDQIEFIVFGSTTFGRHNISWGGQYLTTLNDHDGDDDELPSYAWFSGGGFMNMSGFEPNSLLGTHYGSVLAGYRYQVAESKLLPGYVGMTLEYGNATFNDRSEIFSDGILNGSAYFAYRTPLGPVYLGVGWGGDRHAIYFLRLGSVFGAQSLGRR